MQRPLTLLRGTFPQVARKAESGANFLKYHKLNTYNFQVLTDRVTQAGGQIFEDYGDSDNEL